MPDGKNAKATPPPLPAFVRRHDDPPRFLTPVRRALRHLYVRASERGLFGLTPLDTHVVICGFPRSGTTLLQAMVETSTAGARAYGKERSAMAVARYTWPGRHPVLITKKPDDIFRVSEIRDYYLAMQTKARFILSVRDPRAVLTSVFVAKPGYCVPPDKWRAVSAHIDYQRQFPDVTLVEYRDVVERPGAVQEQLAAFTGCEIKARFDEFHTAVPSSFDTRALNGVRPVDRASLDKWREPRHRERIRQILAELPELPERLIELGYEADTAWVREYD